LIPPIATKMLIPNIPYEDLGDCLQIAKYHAAWVMHSTESTNYLALADVRPQHCGCEVVRQASYSDIQTLMAGLPVLSKRQYQIGTEQGFVRLDAVLIDRKYRWIATLEPPIAHKINNPIIVAPKRTIDRPPATESDQPITKSKRSIVFRRQN
jgi:hypothetical protein